METAEEAVHLIPLLHPCGVLLLENGPESGANTLRKGTSFLHLRRRDFSETVDSVLLSGWFSVFVGLGREPGN